MLKSLNVTVAFPVIAGLFVLLFLAYYIHVVRPRRGTLEWVPLESKPRLAFSLALHRLDRRDLLPMLLITVLYAAVAFLYLGDTRGIASFHRFTESEPAVVIETDGDTEIGSIQYFTGLWSGDYSLAFSRDGVNWDLQSCGETDYAMPQEYSNLFKWRTSVIQRVVSDTRYIRISAARYPLELGEVAFYDGNGVRLDVSRFVCAEGPELLDEQELVPLTETCLNSAYFDEIYHVRTAYEHSLGVYPYEVSHPPLGKLLICLSITLFGSCPFGWRFMGTLFGTLMLPILYCFLKNLFGKRPVAICGTLLLAFDFMHFTQTRIATIDTYGVFFILLMYWWFFRYLTVPKDAPFRKSVLPLFLSGLFFGLGAASKWTAIYGGAGLAVLLLLQICFRLRDALLDGTLNAFFRWLGKTMLVCIPFFVLIPGVIYVLAYLPYGFASGMTLQDGMLWDPAYYKIVWDNQVFMFTYHAGLNATHPYSSVWYQWLLDIRPILYYRRYENGDAIKSAISSFGNPAVWWGGLAAILCMGWRAVRRRDGRALFILLGYLAQLLPWVFISRVVFVYHYFPSTVFLVLALSYLFDTIWERGAKSVVLGYTCAAGGLFAAFYPSISGYPISAWYTDGFLRWLPGSWPL